MEFVKDVSDMDEQPPNKKVQWDHGKKKYRGAYFISNGECKHEERYVDHKILRNLRVIWKLAKSMQCHCGRSRHTGVLIYSTDIAPVSTK
ncbi:hypothetical protein CAEBREN_05699 [Caenorhabditis brenneri]|uniref:Uncharacterized protein n=1 Tax=Caenorhabditis brenneri TaxID=135651 RepID=G0MCI4_CAEBE|nr:hypothetical protein CAEBREN_05699 [Caenorhabditis brenneri]